MYRYEYLRRCVRSGRVRTCLRSCCGGGGVATRYTSSVAVELSGTAPRSVACTRRRIGERGSGWLAAPEEAEAEEAEGGEAEGADLRRTKSSPDVGSIANSEQQHSAPQFSAIEYATSPPAPRSRSTLRTRPIATDPSPDWNCATDTFSALSASLGNVNVGGSSIQVTDRQSNSY